MDALKFMWTWLNPSNTDGLFCSETEEFFGGVQTVTHSQRLHSTAHKCSTFNPAADVQEDTWLTITPRSKVSEQGNLYLMLPRSYWKQVKLLPASLLSWRRKVFICDIETDKEQQPARGHCGYPAGTGFRRKKWWRCATCGTLSLWYQSAKRLGSIRV